MNPQARFLDYSAALLIFPGLWLVGLSLLFQVENAIGIDLMPSLILRFALGFFCYAAAWVTVSHRGVRYGDRGLTLFLHILQHVVAAVLIVAVTLYFAEFYWAFAEPIGANTDSGIGPCKREELSSKPNGRGLIANLRRTTCMGGWDEVPEYFVFVHKSRRKFQQQSCAALRCRSTVLFAPASPAMVIAGSLEDQFA